MPGIVDLTQNDTKRNIAITDLFPNGLLLIGHSNCQRTSLGFVCGCVPVRTPIIACVPDTGVQRLSAKWGAVQINGQRHLKMLFPRLPILL